MSVGRVDGSLCDLTMANTYADHEQTKVRRETERGRTEVASISASQISQMLQCRSEKQERETGECFKPLELC